MSHDSPSSFHDHDAAMAESQAHPSAVNDTRTSIIVAYHVSVSSSPPQLQQPPVLYRHALECVFAFLPLSDLIIILRVCRDWSSAVESMRSADFVFLAQFKSTGEQEEEEEEEEEQDDGAEAEEEDEDDGADDDADDAAADDDSNDAAAASDCLSALSAACSSRLARHVGTMFLGQSGHLCIDAKQLQLVARRMNQLHTLHCGILPPPPDDDDCSRSSSGFPKASLVFPPKLTTLVLYFPSPVSAPWVNSVLLAASRLPLLRSLLLDFPSSVSSSAVLSDRITFSPLQSAHQLSTFGFKGYRPTPNDAQLDEWRGMTKLQRIDIWLGKAQLRRLLRQPNSLQLEYIDMWMDVQFCASLPELMPSITQLKCTVSGETKDFGFITRLTNLRKLEMHGGIPCDSSSSSSEDTSSLQQFIDAMRHPKLAAQLTSLTLQQLALSLNNMCEIMEKMTSLQSLKLESPENLTSLRFLSVGSIPLTLTHFGYICGGARSDVKFPIADVEFLFGLRNLTSLRIDLNTFDAPLDEETRRKLHSMPKIKLFECCYEDGEWE